MRTTNILAIVGAIALGAAMAGPASATALHGACNVTSGGSCADNTVNTPLGSATEFGFEYSGSTETGTFSLDILLPNNYADPSSFSVTETNSTVLTANRVSTTAWTSGKLAAYLGITASPDNSIGAYLDSSETALDSSATGFFVYQVTLTDFTLGAQSSPTMQFDSVSGLGLGSYILGFLSNSTDCSPKECATANSGALLVNGTTTVPEPGSLALFAGALAALGLFVGLRRRAPKA